MTSATMSEMTSSNQPANQLARGHQQHQAAATQTHQPKERDDARATNATGKPLTDFSIDSIMGGDNAMLPVRQSDRKSGGIVSTRRRSSERLLATCCARARASEQSAAETPMSVNGSRDLASVEKNHIDEPTLLNNMSCSINRQPNVELKMDLEFPLAGAKKQRPKVFRCNWCPLAFSNNGQLRNHERIHTGERPFRCEFPHCDKSFTRNEELTRHKLIHTGFRPHLCARCEKSFGRKDHLKKHEKTHERKKSNRRAGAQAAHLKALPTTGDYNALPSDMFLPMKQAGYSPALSQSLPITFDQLMHTGLNSPPIFHNHQLAPVHYQNHSATSPPSNGSIPANLLGSQLASLAAVVAATTTANSSLPTMNAPLNAQAIMTSAAAAAAAATAYNPMQQLASNYWQGWFNLLDQQNQQQQQQLFQTLNNS